MYIDSKGEILMIVFFLVQRLPLEVDRWKLIGDQSFAEVQPCS
jgi:hypothetical protein